MRRLFIGLLLLSLMSYFSACAGPDIIQEPAEIPSSAPQTSPTEEESSIPKPSPERPTAITTQPKSTPAPNQKADSESVDWPLVRSIDIVASFQLSKGGKWFSVDQDELPETQVDPEAFFLIEDHAQDNRKNGCISSTLPAGYFFIQWDISRASLEQFIDTVRALFIRSALLSFVDYQNNRVLGWDRKSAIIAADVSGIISLCNEKDIPVFLEINYSDYVPGELGTGVESLILTDNIANTVAFLSDLEEQCRFSRQMTTFGKIFSR